MPLDKLILILFCVMTGAGVTIWLVTLILASAIVHPALAFAPLSVAALGAYILVRVLGERVNNPEEDHYDKMDH